MPNPTGPIVTSITRTHYAQLDGLRGLAILLVVFYHFSLPHRDFHGPGAGVFLQLAQAGWMGVDLFFVSPGFSSPEFLSRHASNRTT